MKNLMCHIFSVMFTVCGFLLLWNNTFSAFSLSNHHTIYTNNESDAINTELSATVDISNPIREGAYSIVHSSNWNYVLSWIVDSDSEITTHGKALDNTLWIVRNVVNYALGSLSLVALVYIIIQWLIMVTAMWDDSKLKKWMKWIKRAVVAIAWIWLSWFIVSFIIWIVRSASWT